MEGATSVIEPLSFSGVRLFRAISEADPEAHSIALLLTVASFPQRHFDSV